MSLIENASDAYVFCNNYLKFFYFLFWYYSFQCLCIVRFDCDIVLSSSNDGSDKRGYTMWCQREGTFSLLNCIWLHLKVVQIHQT